MKSLRNFTLAITSCPRPKFGYFWILFKAWKRALESESEYIVKNNLRSYYFIKISLVIYYKSVCSFKWFMLFWCLIFLCKVSILNINLFSKTKRTEKQLKECLFLRNAFFSWNFREKIYTFCCCCCFTDILEKIPEIILWLLHSYQKNLVPMVSFCHKRNCFFFFLSSYKETLRTRLISEKNWIFFRDWILVGILSGI